MTQPIIDITVQEEERTRYRRLRTEWTKSFMVRFTSETLPIESNLPDSFSWFSSFHLFRCLQQGKAVTFLRCGDSLVYNEDMTKQITQFESLDSTELKNAIRDVLEGVAHVDRPRDERVDVDPYVGLIDLYKSSLPDLKDRMSSVFKVLIDSELDTLSDSGKHNLFRVLQDCGDRLIDTIETIARRQTLVAKSKELHALVLKCLISLNCRQSSEFWLKQLDALGAEYGAVILSGLLQHGIETGFRYLPQLTQSDAAARRIAMALPGIADQFGEDEVKRQVAKALPRCTSQAQKLMQVVFPVSELETRDVSLSKLENLTLSDMTRMIEELERKLEA